MQKETDCIFGLHAVIEAIKAGKQIDRLLIKQGLQGALYHELMTEVKAHNIVYQIVPVERIELVTRKNHQGVLAWLSVIEYQYISNLLPMVYDKGEDPLIIALDGVSDVRNFGAIVRTAECLGAHAVIIPEKGSARITADAVKTSAGALLTIPVCREENLGNALKFLVSSGIKLVAASEKATKNYIEAGMKEPIAIVMGAEDEGVNPDHLRLCDEMVSIPMLGSIGSLNVSVAAGVLIYEAVRQRGNV